MKVNGVPIIERYVSADQSVALEPMVYEKDLLIPIDGFGKPMYFRIPGKLIKEVVDANTPHVNKIKR